GIFIRSTLISMNNRRWRFGEKGRGARDVETVHYPQISSHNLRSSSTLCGHPSRKKREMKLHRKSSVASISTGRALWLDEELCAVDRKELLYVNGNVGCPFCKSDAHDADECILNPLNIFQNGWQRRIMLAYCMCSNVVPHPRHLIPYEYPMRATVLHVDNVNNVLYVRSHGLDLENKLLDDALRQIDVSAVTMESAKHVSIGAVYIVYRRSSKRFARAVCNQFRVKFNSVTRWQMYLIDLGIMECIEQTDIYPLANHLSLFPPMALPLVLSDCRWNNTNLSACKTAHFHRFAPGSPCVFVVSSTCSGHPLSLKNAYGYPLAVRSVYPPAVISRVFYGDTPSREILCPESDHLNIWSSLEAKNAEIRSRVQLEPYMPGAFRFPAPTQNFMFPVRLLVRVTEKVDANIYWLRRVSTCRIISRCIVTPSSSLSPYIREGRTLACLASLVLPSETKPRFYRAVASGFNLKECSCMAFLIDHGIWVMCNIYNLFDLSEQPSSVLDTPGAAFRCRISAVSPHNVPLRSSVKLAVDEKFIIDVISADRSGLFFAKMQFSHPQKGMRWLCIDGISDENWDDSTTCSTQIGPGDTPQSSLPSHSTSYANHMRDWQMDSDDISKWFRHINLIDERDGNVGNVNQLEQRQYAQHDCDDVIAMLQALNAKFEENFRYLSRKLELVLEYSKFSQMHSRFASGPPMPTCPPIRPDVTPVLLDLSELRRKIAAYEAALQVGPNNVVVRQLSSLRMRQFAARATASNIGMHEVHPHAQFQARTLYAPSVMQSVQMGQLHANPEVQVAANTAVGLSRRAPIYIACPGCSCLVMIGYEASTTFSSVPRAYIPPSSSDLFSQNPVTSGSADSATTATSCKSGHSIKNSCSSSDARCSQSSSLSSGSDSEPHVSVRRHGADLVYVESSQDQTASCVDGFTNLKGNGKDSEPSSTVGGCVDSANNGDGNPQCRVIDEVGNAFSKSNEDSEAAMEKSANKVEKTSQEKDAVLDESHNKHALNITTSDDSIVRNSSSMVTEKNRRSADAESKKLRSGNCSRERRNSLAERSGAELGKVMPDSRQRTRSVLPVKWNYGFRKHGTIAQRLSCWICGEVDRPTDYCAVAPTQKEADSLKKMLLASFLTSHSESLKVQKSGIASGTGSSCRSGSEAEKADPADKKPRKEKKVILYTSDESSDEEASDSDMSTPPDSAVASSGSTYPLLKPMNASGFAGSDDMFNHRITLNLDTTPVAPSSSRLKYHAWMRCVSVTIGGEFEVERCDDDVNYTLWPLFFVHILNEHNDQILETVLSSLQADNAPPLSFMEIGLLCISYCKEFDARYRAIITAIDNEHVEVFYVDYGNYEWVNSSCLWSIEKQPYNIRTHPPLAVPCLLSDYGVEVEADRKLDDKDVKRLKAMAGFDHAPLCAKFMAQREDGIYVVHIVQSRCTLK
uniref:Tudor domain-containing protein n=1 Tax=Parascaris univalens TaxID=6257 RepID=A0A915BQM7_PARUN